MSERFNSPNVHVRPMTWVCDLFERVQLDEAMTAIQHFNESGEPTSVWSHSQWSDSRRSSALSNYEINQQISSIFELCGVTDNFHQQIKLLRKPNDDFIPTEQTFGTHTPKPTEIVQWLGDFDTFTRDDVNDFETGFIIDTPKALVAFKYRSEEAGVCCNDCNLHDLDPGKSCDHFIEEFDIESTYQICLYPKDALNQISFYADKFGRVY